MEEVDTLVSSADSGVFGQSEVEGGVTTVLAFAYQEEDLTSQVLAPAFDNLDDQDVQNLLEKMTEQRPQADLAQASQRVIETLSELIAQLVIPAVLHHLQSREPRPMSVDGEIIKYVSCDDNGVELMDAAPMRSPFYRFPGSPKLEDVRDLERFFELAPQKTVKAIVNNMDRKEGMKTDSHAWKILRFLSMKMKCTEDQTEEDLFKLRCESPPCSCFDRRFENKFRETFTKGYVRPDEKKSEDIESSPLESTSVAYPLTVSSEQVINEVSSKEFRATSLKALVEFLHTSLDQFSPCFGTTSSSPSVDTAASDLLDTVTTSVTQLSLPRPKLFSWPWQKKKCSTVSEEAFCYTARELKNSLQEKLRRFFYGHKMDEAQKQIEGTRDFMGDPALISVEKIISQEQLVLFSNMVTNRVTYMFQEKVQHFHKLQNPNAESKVDGYPWTTFRGELHLFIVDSVKCLLASIAFPPSFWRMDQVIQDNAAAKGKTLDDVVTVCSERVTDQVMEHISRSSMRE